MNMTKDNTLANFPQTLKELSLWTLWKLETRDGAQTKVPYRIDGKKASPTNPNDWTDFATACRAFDPEKYSGLGFVLTKEDGIVCIDLDNCIGEDGQICDEAKHIVRMLNSWTEISQSGKGLHIFIRAKKPTDKSKATPRTFKSLEIYDNARFIAMTGNHLPGTPLTIEHRQGGLNALCVLYFPERESTPAQAIKPYHDSLTDEEIISLCRKAQNADKFVALYDNGDTSGYNGDESRAEQALACMLAFYTKDAAQIERLMNDSALAQREKWRERQDYRERTIRKAISLTREHYEPNHNAMARNEAAATDQMPNQMEKKYPLEKLNGASQTQTETETETEYFTDETFDECLEESEKQPPITPLFDVFWGKGELTFLFGSTGIGKSILAVQILDAISKGAKVQSFDGPQETMRVGLFDFELSGRQHLKRYSDENGNRHKFSPNFFRFGIKAYAKIPKGVPRQDYILEQIEKKIIKRRIEVVVIDNLTALLKKITETEDALELMDKLVEIKLRHNISMLVIGHTRKRDLSKPLTEDDMSGSKQLLNLCDSAFAIGKSMKESHLRYLKQIKCRSAEYKYDSGNVATFRVTKIGSYLCLEHIGFDDEKEHLRERTDAELSELEMNIIALHQSDPNLSYAEIAKQLNTNKMRVSRVLKKEMQRAEKALNRQNSGFFNTPNPF